MVQIPDNSEYSKINKPFVNFDDAENIPASLESKMYRQRRLDMCDRVFESIVYDLKLLVKQFENESIGADLFLKELERILASLRLFSSKGEVRTLIARASTVIIDQVSKEITPDDMSSTDEEEIMHC